MQPSDYGPFPYSPIVRRPRLEWPDGARIALWVIPNIEFFSLQQPMGGAGHGQTPDVPAWCARDYGNRIGVWRIMEVLDRHDIRATVALNSDICRHHPEIIEEGMKRGWEWMGHNETNSRRLTAGDRAEEARIIRSCLSTIAEATGARPKGWLSSGLQQSWESLDLLAAEGVEYVGDWVNDDQPYRMALDGGGHMLSVPYSHDINDKPVYDAHHRTPAEFQEMICRQFDVLYREGAESGRVMAIALHPYLTGVPYRIGALDAALDYICGHDGVWRTTGAEIARHFAEIVPQDDAARRG